MNKSEFNKKLLNIFGIKFCDFFYLLDEMELYIDGIFYSVPVVFPILIDNSGVRVKIKLPLILVKSHIIDMIKIVNHLFPFFARHNLNLFRYRLLIRQRQLDNKYMIKQLELPKQFNRLVNLLQLYQCDMIYFILIIVLVFYYIVLLLTLYCLEDIMNG